MVFYIWIPVLEKDFHFSGSDWNGLITMVKVEVFLKEGLLDSAEYYLNKERNKAFLEMM